MATGRYRPRKEFKFWLFHDLAEDVRLMEFIAYCKSKRRFASVLRNGIRLMWSLGEGNTDVLDELFPWVKQQYQPAPPAPDDRDLEDRIAKRIEATVQQAMMQMPSLPATAIVAAPSKSPAAPVAVTKTAASASASEIADNFLAFIQ